MRMSKILIVFGLILGLGLLASPGSATVVTSIAGRHGLSHAPPSNIRGRPAVFRSGITWTSAYYLFSFRLYRKVRFSI